MKDELKLRELVLDGIATGANEFRIVANIMRKDKTLTPEEAAEFCSSVIQSIAAVVSDVEAMKPVNLAIAVVRLNHIYQNAVDTNQLNSAIAAQKELNRLLNVEPVEGKDRLPGNRGKSPSVAIQINNSNHPKNLTDLSDEQLLELAGKGVEVSVVKPVHSLKALPTHVLESEATEMLHKQELEDDE